MSDPSAVLRALVPQHEFFVGLDSDGCVFDTMEIKHRECFVPMFIKHFRLQPVARAAREVWEFVNLYSRTRGINRYPALSNALNLLAERAEVHDRGVDIPSTDELDAWLARERRHTQANLQREIRQGGNEALQPILDWSLAVDAQIQDLVRGIPPFPGVRECLQWLRGKADLAVISQTPSDALQREWAEHDLTGWVSVIAGQEMGTKREHLRDAAGSKYSPGKVLMVGDAPSDFMAAKSNGALFFPILPGREESSWRRLLGEGLEAFFEGRYTGDFETSLVNEFNAALPEHPPWS